MRINTEKTRRQNFTSYNITTSTQLSITLNNLTSKLQEHSKERKKGRKES